MGCFLAGNPRSDRAGEPGAASPCRGTHMTFRRGQKSDDLAALYARHLRYAAKMGWRAPTADRERALKLARLQAKGIVTVTQLLKRLPGLSPSLRQFAIEFIGLCDIHRAWPVLIELLSDRSNRAMCADVLSRLKSRGKATKYFRETGRRELASSTADRSWLEAVILGIGWTDEPRAAEVLVEIFERPDLPGWLRGNAGDKLGLSKCVRDRRTKLYRRCRAAALRGLHDQSVDVQFWSMYVIGSLATNYGLRRQARRGDFNQAIPKLRHMAKHDQRLAPGYWWPMSAEAVDVLACLETGQWQEPEAAERFKYSGARGESQRT